MINNHTQQIQFPINAAEVKIGNFQCRAVGESANLLVAVSFFALGVYVGVQLLN